MDTINLLWKLEGHNLILNQFKSELDILKDSIEINELYAKLDEIDNRYDSQINRLKNTKEKIRKSEIILKNQEFLHKEKKDLLYWGNITDVKQLAQLDREEQEIRIDIDNMESEIINNLEEVDSIEEELGRIQSQASQINKDIKKQVEASEKRIKDIIQMVAIEKDVISSLTSKIDKNTLVLYEKIRKQKSNGIVAVLDDICTGCNMRIPNYQKKPLIEGKEIIMCESCGRILYREDK